MSITSNLIAMAIAIPVVPYVAALIRLAAEGWPSAGWWIGGYAAGLVFAAAAIPERAGAVTGVLLSALAVLLTCRQVPRLLSARRTPAEPQPPHPPHHTRL